MYCNNNNSSCKLCNRLIISNSVSIVTVDGTDTLVIDIPAATYMDGYKYCLIIAQSIPTTATISTPVAISIGGVTTTVYPLTRCNCAQVTACAIRTRTKYPVLVSTNATGGVFKVLSGLSCAPNNALASLPVVATTATAEVATLSLVDGASKTTKTTTTTVKEVISRE